MEEVRLAHYVGRQINLVILNGDYSLKEVVKLIGPSQPIAVTEEPSRNRATTVRVSGEWGGHLTLDIDGQIVPFLQARSLQNPGESASDLSVRLSGEYKVVI